MGFPAKAVAQRSVVLLGAFHGVDDAELAVEDFACALGDVEVALDAIERGIGTAAGAFGPDADVTRLAPSFAGPAFAVTVFADSTWVGTPAGLLRLRRDDTGAVWP